MFTRRFSFWSFSEAEVLLETVIARSGDLEVGVEMFLELVEIILQPLDFTVQMGLGGKGVLQNEAGDQQSESKPPSKWVREDRP